jgi:hypothetical protein
MVTRIINPGVPWWSALQLGDAVAGLRGTLGNRVRQICLTLIAWPSPASRPPAFLHSLLRLSLELRYELAGLHGDAGARHPIRSGGWSP